MQKNAIAIGKGNGWTMTTLMMLLPLLLFMTAGCAEIKLGTLPTPPSKAKLRVFVKAVSGETKGRWRTPHEDFEKSTYSMAARYFSGAYDIVTLEEVHLVAGDEELSTWQWSRNDWAMAVEVGRRLYAEYALIVERSQEPNSFLRFLLINVDTKINFEVLAMIPGDRGSHRDWSPFYRISIAKLFNDANEDILATANRKSRAVSSELEVAMKEILELTKIPVKGIQADRPLQEKESVSREMPSAVDAGRDGKVAALEAKLARLTETLTQLEVMKKQIEDQRKQSDTLARELAEKEQREKMLLSKLEDSAKTAPVILLAYPREDSTVDVNFVQLSGVVEDEKGLRQLEIYINDKPITKGSDRGIRVAAEANPKRLEFTERVFLGKGANRLKIRAVDSDGLITEKTVTVQYVEKLKNIWAVVIGIDKYPNIRQLKYAVSDAGLFYDHLVKRNQIPAENVMLLLNQDATLMKIKSVLGTDLKNKAGKDDMVVIYFAGHGATERDAQSPDGDGLEKYLLPFDADLKDLYATALPMEELSNIFNRIRSERLIFIADACYSGASGGRTIGMSGMRASISEAFIDRIAGGKGRVIMTASGANEVSAEKDELGHGVFTYYLVEGLKGKADTDRDGVVTVDEAYNYVSRHVPAATAQEQHPVKKGAVEGRLILSITQ
ncbi:MAG: caspase family protein [Desulfobacterales bacterium]|nr:caspase family protein [Desulfobacterales bacterium]